MTRRGIIRGMGFTLPYGGFTSNYETVATRAGMKWIRIGTPEIPDMCATPNNTSDAGTFDTTDLEDIIDDVHNAGLGFIFSFLGVPRQVNSNAGSSDPASGGDWHWYPTDGTGRTQMALYAAAVAGVLIDKQTANGLPCMIQIGNEFNQPAFNHDGTSNPTTTGASKTVCAQYLAECILAVRAVEPTLTIIAGSLANRGDIHNGADAGKTAGDWVAGMISGDTRLKGTGSDARPDMWAAHPYVGSAPPLQGWTVNAGVAEVTSGYGWGFAQLIDYYDQLVSAGATAPDGSYPKMCITEWGIHRADPGFTEAIQQNYVQQQMYAYDILSSATVMDDPWLVPPELYYEELGDDKSLYGSGSPYTPYAAGGYHDFLSLYDPPVDPPVDPEVPTGEDLDVTVELGIPPTVTINTTNFMLGDDPRAELGGSYGLSTFYQYLPITGDVQEIQIDRNQPREMNRTEPGTCTVTVRNDRVDNDTAGDYDPFNWASPFFPFLGPRARIRVTVDGQVIFGGDLTDMPIVDVQDNVVVTTFQAADIAASLTKTIRYKPEALHNAGGRCHRILERAGAFARGDGEYLFPGVYEYQAGQLQEGTALDMLSDVAYAEGGLFYATNQGNAFVFIDHNHMHGTTETPTPPLFLATDNPNSDGIRYSDITRTSGLDLLYNTVSIKNLNPKSKPQTVHDDTSSGIYGERPLELVLPFARNSAGHLGRYVRAVQLLHEYKNPQPRFASVTFPTARYAVATRRPFLVNQEVGHVIEVERTPPGDITPASFSQTCVIHGVSHTIRPRWMETTFLLTPQFPS